MSKLKILSVNQQLNPSTATLNKALVRAIAPNTMLQPQRLLKCYKRCLYAPEYHGVTPVSVTSHGVKPL